ncbi:hypothetical protein GQ457_02G033710 [Hibiscus cannabinus]
MLGVRTGKEIWPSSTSSSFSLIVLFHGQAIMRPLEIMMLHHLPDDMQTPPSASANNPYYGRASTAVGNVVMEEKQIFQNVQMSVNFLVSLKKSWQNVRCL